jgi:hypothetical protein
LTFHISICLSVSSVLAMCAAAAALHEPPQRLGLLLLLRR